MNLPFGCQLSATARLAVSLSFSHYFSISCKVTLLEKNKTGDIPLINISKQFYVFPCDESLEPFLSNYLNVIIASAILCFLWLTGCTETAAVE